MPGATGAAWFQSACAAGIWRFTPASVRAALDTGWTAEDLLTELNHRPAPTVLSSPAGLDEVLTRLREVGLSPMAEDAQGAVIVESRHEHQAPALDHPIIATPRSALFTIANIESVDPAR